MSIIIKFIISKNVNYNKIYFIRLMSQSFFVKIMQYMLQDRTAIGIGNCCGRSYKSETFKTCNTGLMSISFFPSFSVPDVLYDPIDLIWRERSAFEAMTDCKTLIEGFQLFSGILLSCKVCAQPLVSSHYHFYRQRQM